MKLSDILEGDEFAGITGGEAGRGKDFLPVDKLVIDDKDHGGEPFTDNQVLIVIDKFGHWYLHDDGKPHLGIQSKKSSGYFKDKKAAQKVLNKYKGK